MQKTNIKKEIYIEKTNFISDNSSFFHYNINNFVIMRILKNILLNPAPLKECDGYEELIEEIKTKKIRQEKENIYLYTMETIFKIVYIIRFQINFGERNDQQTEQIRQYLKYVNEKNTGKMYYSKQNVISFQEKNIQFVKQQKRRF